MKILRAIQNNDVSDAVGVKFAMVAPVIEATLYSLDRSRLQRLGGVDAVTLRDLAREFREGHGDAGICFELAVHEALSAQNTLIHPLVSETLESFCRITGGAHSILFGPEKNGIIPILESVEEALTDESRIYVGNRGQPPKLKKYIPQIINAFRRNEARNRLPRSISGLWKADLFIGNKDREQWIGTTIKINPEQLVGAPGLRIGLYPKRHRNDGPRKDENLNLIRLPLPYDGQFMEVFYKSFYLVRAFLRADARVPRPVDLPDAEDRFITNELKLRSEFPVKDVLDVIRNMAQSNLLHNKGVSTVTPGASLSEHGLDAPPIPRNSSELISIAPIASPQKRH
jgi:hypothetical protein